MGLESQLRRGTQKLKILGDMGCDREFSAYGCKSCDYYYLTEYGSADCLKKNVRAWALYEIEKGNV